MGRLDATRRHYLRTLGLAGIAGLAGCSSNGNDDDSSETAIGDQTTTTEKGMDTMAPTVTVTPTATLTPAQSPPSQSNSAITPTQRAKLAADDGDDEDNFGVQVAVSADGTTAIVSADADEDPDGTMAGAAYVFEFSDGVWSQRRKSPLTTATMEIDSVSP
jgi:hypothetical protein